MSATFAPSLIKNLVPLHEAIEQLSDLAPYKDRVIERPTFYSSGKELLLTDQDDSGFDGQFDPDSKGLAQTLARLGLPQAVGATALDLGATKELAGLMNKAWNRKQNPILFRQVETKTGPAVFSAMSPSYKRMDTRMAFPHLLEKLDGSADWQVSRIVTTTGHSRLMAVAMDRAEKIRRDDLVPAITFQNSDDGGGRLTLTIAVWRILCANGMATPILQGASLNRLHRGSRMGGGEQPDAGVPQEVMELAPNTEGVWEAFRQSSQLIEAAMNEQVQEPGYLEGLASWAGATFAERDAMARMEGYDESVWGFTNRLTQLARDHSRPEMTTAFEAKAWDYLTRATRAHAGLAEAWDFNSKLALVGRELLADSK